MMLLLPSQGLAHIPVALVYNSNSVQVQLKKKVSLWCIKKERGEREEKRVYFHTYKNNGTYTGGK